MKKEDWIPLSEKTPPLNTDVLVSRPPKKGFLSTKPMTNIAYLFKIEKGEITGQVYGPTSADKINLIEGGTF